MLLPRCNRHAWILQDWFKTFKHISGCLLLLTVKVSFFKCVTGLALIRNPSSPSVSPFFVFLSLCTQSLMDWMPSWLGWPLLGSLVACQGFVLTPSVLWKLLCSILTALLLSPAHWCNHAVVPLLQPTPTQQKQHTPYQVWVSKVNPYVLLFCILSFPHSSHVGICLVRL